MKFENFKRIGRNIIAGGAVAAGSIGGLANAQTPTPTGQEEIAKLREQLEAAKKARANSETQLKLGEQDAEEVRTAAAAAAALKQNADAANAEEVRIRAAAAKKEAEAGEPATTVGHTTGGLREKSEEVTTPEKIEILEGIIRNDEAEMRKLQDQLKKATEGKTTPKEAETKKEPTLQERVQAVRDLKLTDKKKEKQLIDAIIEQEINNTKHPQQKPITASMDTVGNGKERKANIDATHKLVTVRDEKGNIIGEAEEFSDKWLKLERNRIKANERIEKGKAKHPQPIVYVNDNRVNPNQSVPVNTIPGNDESGTGSNAPAYVNAYGSNSRKR